jgi:hypothetical protein
MLQESAERILRQVMIDNTIRQFDPETGRGYPMPELVVVGEEVCEGRQPADAVKRSAGKR